MAATSTERREEILHAAFRALSRGGYENTSVKDIAEEAGVAQGLVHYYFKSKQALVLAVLAMCCAEMQLPGGGDPAGNALTAFEYFKGLLRNRRDVHSLYVELIGVGLHDPEVGAGVLGFVRQDRAKVEAIAREVLAAGELPSGRAAAIAGAVWGGCLGVMIQQLVDPEFDAEAAVDALAALSMAAARHPAELR